MSRIVAIGEHPRIDGFALAGVQLLAADDADEVRAAWSRLDRDVGVVLLTPEARAALSDVLSLPSRVIWTVLPI